ncbi:MAG TPA: HAMP domain-containing sensor histidine kinase [Acidobacteriaceae bacterium]|nr:HAMP domain-containing sensor histidine kinase [Acidobacteriaceae bacterium]
MQAQSQSSLAARIPSSHSLPPPAATSPRTTPSALHQTPSALHPTPSALLPPHPAAPPAPSLAEAGGLAHDAGNLLAALGLYCDLLHVPGVLRAEHQHYATELRLISDRSARLIHRLLATPAASLRDVPALRTADAAVRPSKLFRTRSARASDIRTDSSNHAAMLLSLTPVLRRIAAGAADVTVTCQISLPPLNFPSEIIERITVNLVRNAAEAIRREQACVPALPIATPGQIRVTLAVIAARVQLIVEDNGPGMSPTNVEAYLHPEPLPPGAHHGLGHRIVHELATATQGQLSIRVRPGQGTAFCLKWPIPAPQPAEPCPADLPSTLTTA